MNKKVIKIVFIFVATLALYFSLTTTAKAYLSISTSKSTVSPGESFSVTVSVSSNEAGAISLSASNGSLSSTYVDLMSQPSVTISCTAGSSGTVTISGSGKVANYNTETEEQQSASKSVQIAVPEQNNNSGGSSSSNSSSGTSTRPSTTTNSKPKTNNDNEKPKEEEKKSDDATLKELQVEGYDLYPEFNTDTLEYNIKVPNDITEANIVLATNDSKASASVEGTYSDLQVGENIAKIIVTAEDGTTREYVIKINRAREALKVTNIILFYIDEEGNNNELVLTPTFDPEVFEYNLDNLSYLVSKLELDVLTNLEEAEVEIVGNDELVEGENTITITVKVPSDGEEEDEVVQYKIIVNKEKAPKFPIIGKIKKWFKGIFGTISEWYNNNQFNIMLFALALCSATMGGLVVYLAIDYKKYKKLLEKVKELSQIDNSEVALTSETKVETNENIVDKAEPENNDDENQIVEEKIFKAKGRHF